jgi:hypothetical protein
MHRPFLLLQPLVSFLASPWGKLLVVAFGASSLMGCSPEIGDKCTLSTDCSIRGDRLCDTSQPGGYCTIFNCSGNSCPEEAACVLFNANLPGCGYDDRAPGRTSRSFCMFACSDDSDCRGEYMCADPGKPPWNALILDNDQGTRVCIPKPTQGVNASFVPDAGADAGVCQAVPEAGSIPVSPRDGGSDAAASDAAADALDGAIEDASDSGG